MPRRSRHTKEELQTLIIEATLALVREHGAGDVTARRIAEAVGYTPGMLYSAFTNLQEIFLHVNAVSLGTLHDLCTVACRDADGPEASMRAMSLAYLAFAEDNTHQFDLMFQRMEQREAGLPEALSRRIRPLLLLIEHQLLALAPSADEERVRIGARVLWSGVHGTAELALSRQLYLDHPHADRAIVDMLVSSFVASWRETPE